MAQLNPQIISAAGLVPTTVSAAGGGDFVVPSGGGDDRGFLQVTNGGGSPITVSIADPYLTPVGNAGTVVPVSVAAGATKSIALSPGAINPANGQIAISYSAVTSVTVAYVRR